MADWKTRITQRFQKALNAGESRLRTGTFKLTQLQPASLMGSLNQSDGSAAFIGKVLTVVLCSYFLADVIALGVGSFIPEPPRASQFSIGEYRDRRAGFGDYEIIVRRNLINSEGLIPGEDVGEVQDPGGAPVRTTLPFNLVGTVVLQNAERSIATIQDTSASKVYAVKPQDEIRGTARILSVEPRRVVFINLRNGRKEFAELPEEPTKSPRVSVSRPSRGGGGGGIEQRSATQFNVSRSVVDEALSNFNQVLTQARAVPNFENGMPAGYKLFQIVPGSIYDKLGLQNGDVLCGVNGDPIDNPGKAFEMLNELKTANQLELCVKRGGNQQTFSYDIN